MLMQRREFGRLRAEFFFSLNRAQRLFTIKNKKKIKNRARRACSIKELRLVLPILIGFSSHYDSVIFLISIYKSIFLVLID